MSNSSLISMTHLSPNCSKGRTADGKKYSVDRITPHCTAGKGSVEDFGNLFGKTSRGASCNYAIGEDGRIGLICDEANRSWCSSSKANDVRAITIEASSSNAHPYAINENVYKSLVNLCADICKRYGKTKLLWFADKNKSLSYTPKSDEMLITVHRWFANKACPGDYIYNRLGQITDEVNAKLNPKETKKEAVKVIYKTVDDVPEWGKEAVKWAMDKKILQGDGKSIDLNEDLLRCLIFIHRAMNAE